MSRNFEELSEKRMNLNASINGNNQPDQFPICSDRSTFDSLPDELQLMILERITINTDLLLASLVCKKWLVILTKRLTLFITMSVYNKLFSDSCQIALYRQYKNIVLREIEFVLEVLPDRFDTTLRICDNVKFRLCVFFTPEAVTSILYACKNATKLNFDRCEFENQSLHLILDQQMVQQFENARVEELTCFESWELLKVFNRYGINVNKLKLGCENLDFSHVEIIEFLKQKQTFSLKEIDIYQYDDQKDADEFIRALLDWKELQLESLCLTTINPDDLMSKLVAKQKSLKYLECESSINLLNGPIGLQKLILHISNQMQVDQLIRFQNLKDLTFDYSESFELKFSVISQLPRLEKLTFMTEEDVMVCLKDIRPMPNIRHLEFNIMEINNVWTVEIIRAVPNLKTLIFINVYDHCTLPFSIGELRQLTHLTLPVRCIQAITIDNMWLPKLQHLQLLPFAKDDEIDEKILRVLAKTCPLLKEIYGCHYQNKLIFTRSFVKAF